LLPGPEAIENLEIDYKAMDQMFFKAPQPFEEILDTLREAESVLNG
jgi:hypothetical protein